ncbi:HAD-superfamily class IIA hydrolase, TIGR01459 [Roseivivax lentus]|uniref:HAD-superfamily class IIA hydrolase, TIGR01459 n=1 Tax=Roseivivax lentus TaxID=633194 RepID=A0A1N7NFK3_9RHOB|nr:TIGR01459 family HAD-type hydrolase [Roseivivax lentus]SIS97028.1 HAD-superfamily class IIA hydrolase, TIGR01459 [Roseivivax lentus]
MGLRIGAEGDHLTPSEAFAAYEAVRHRLPPAAEGGAAEPVDTLDDLADRFDVFLLDAFGVLNIGEAAIPGVVDRIAGLQAMGKRCIVVTNAAGYPHAMLMARYEKLGYSFAPEDVISSRKTLLAALREAPSRHWGMMATKRFGTEDLEGLDVTFLGEDPADYDAADAFLLLGSAEWTDARQSLLEHALRARPRPVWVGNPDIVAPREQGFSIEPGHFAHRLAEASGVAPEFFGKPFGNIYDLAFARLGAVDRSRILMVGDSLHTDVLGAHTAGIASALVTEHGFFAASDAKSALQAAGISPDFLLARP